MLVLSRRVGEEVVIGEEIRLMVVAVQGNRIRLGVVAPPKVRVQRAEIHVPRTVAPLEKMVSTVANS